MTATGNDGANGSLSVIHFIETSISILHEIPRIELKDVNVSEYVNILSPKCAYLLGTIFKK